MSILLSISDFLDKVCKWVIATFMILMTVILSSQVVSRYVFSTGLAWSEEIVRYFMVWIVFLGATCATKDNSQISVTALEEVLPEVPKKLLIYLQKIIILVYLGIMTWIGFITLKVAKLQTSPNMEIPMNIIYIVIPISMIIMIIHLVSSMYKETKSHI